MNVSNFTGTFTKKPFKERLKDTGYLIRHSFTIIGKDKDIKTPMIKMGIRTTLLRTLFFISLLPVINAGSQSSSGYIALSVLFWFLMVVVLIPVRFFYDVRQKAHLCWIVYNTLCGKDISYRDAVKHNRQQKGKLKMLALGEFAEKYASTFKKDSGFLINLFLGFLSEVWDLLSHFMLPSVVIEQKKLKEIAPDLKSLKKNVPATLTGVFGLDFAGDTVKGFLYGFALMLTLLSLVAGWLLAFVTSAGVVSFGSGAGFAFSWIPVYITIFIIAIVLGLIGKLVESIKVIYFTVFYTSIKQPERIAPKMRKDLTHYLKLQEEEEIQESTQE
jgi:ABC-type multidrug transport system fused ATPase/permease subunit